MSRRRFLAPGGRVGDGHGYLAEPERELDATSEPDPPDVVARIRDATCMVDEPECIGPAIVDAYSESARFFDSARHSLEVEQLREIRRQLSMEQRIAEIRRRAKLQHVNVSTELHALGKMLERARQKGKPDPPAAGRKVEALEGRLDRAA